MHNPSTTTITEPNEPDLTTRTPSEDANEPTGARTRKGRVEFIASILIAIAAALTAVATFQGAQVDGEVQAKHTESITLTLIANDAYNDFNAQRSSERDWFFAAITELQNETPAGPFLVEAMPPPVAKLINEWDRSDDGILDPFSDEASYPALDELPSTARLIDGLVADADAECAVFASLVAEARGENYGLSTVFLAIALVVGGIAAVLTSKTPQIIVLAVSALSLVGGAGLLALAGDADEARLEQAAVYYADDGGNERSAAEALAVADQDCPA